MLGYHCTPAEYAVQWKVESFSHILLQLEEHQLTHIYHVVFVVCKYTNIRYLALRYLNTGPLPFENFSMDWLFDDEAKPLSI